MRRPRVEECRKSMMMLPLMFGFVVMGVVDVAGLCRGYVQADYGLSDSVAGLIPSACFLWFLLISIPAGLAMDRVGRKTMVCASMLVNAIGLSMPFVVSGGVASLFIALALIGIGNTMLFVSLNPLAKDLMGEGRSASTFALGNFLKCTTAVLVPLALGFFSTTHAGWRGALAFFGAVSLIGALWLLFSPLANPRGMGNSSFGSIISLLKDKRMVLCFLASMLLVGIDVLAISFLPQLLGFRAQVSLGRATMLSSIYPAAKTLASLVGGILLLRVRETRFLLVSTIVMLVGLAGLFLAWSGTAVLFFAAVFGCGYANLYSIILSRAFKIFPDCEDGVSSLMITSLAGGAIFTPLAGLL